MWSEEWQACWIHPGNKKIFRILDSNLIRMNRLFLLLFGMVTFVADAQVPDYVPTEGLVAWWPMNGNVDDAIGSLHGFNQGGVETEGPYGHVGQALELPGGDDYIDLPTGGVNEEGGLTLAFWAWLELPTEGSAPLIDRDEVSNNLWSFSYEQSSETIHFMTRNNDGSGYHNLSTWSPPAAEWVHVTSVYRAPSGLKELHVNGSLVSEELAPLDGFTMPTMRLGEVAEGTWNSNCRFSKIGIWERALIDEEILALYNAQLPVLGCTDSIACNFNADANIEDDSCVYALFGEDCETGSAACGEGTIWDVSLQACVGFNDCPSDLDGDGLIGVEDLLSLLSDFGTDCVASDDPETAEWTCGDPVNYHGYDYATVQIGEQCWFAENLRSELYQNGLPIPGGLDNEQWSTTSVGAQSIGPIESNPLTHGRLYNGYALLSANGICPNGWGVPADEDWITLETHIGMTYGFYDYGWRGNQLIGYDLKASANDNPQWNGTNLYGFSATAGGYRNSNGETGGGWSYGYWWSSSEAANNIIWRGLYSASGDIGRNEQEKNFGYSVRCIKD
jgi:uncharacterized protein (TIGR02145 family)